MNANRNANGRMGARNSERRAGAAILAVVVGLGLSASAAFGQYYTDPNYPGWIYDPYYGWIYIGEGETGTPTDDTTTIDTTSTTQVSGTGTHRMVAVGIDQYMQASPLPSCISDVNGFIEATTADSSRWSSANITKLTDSSATTNGIRTALYNMGQMAQAGDVCVFFQSSHGGQISGTSMALSTYDGDYMDTQFGTDLANWFPNGVKIVVIIDACYSAGLFKDGAGKASAARSLNVFTQNVALSFAAGRVAKGGAALDKASSSEIGFITASDFNETSAAGNPYSLFAGKLIDAFRAADSDTNGDGELSFLELFQWAAPRSGSEQSPQASNESLLGGTIAARKTANSVVPDCGGLCGVGCASPMMACVAAIGAMGMGLRRRTRRGR
ncbi:MAG: hypothetical protein DCC65_01690 [Planctomycetota bacterium]|nr:MAG: hypothetical protein DCC65_01690 [Planctomycetota bacterium]